MFVVCLVFFTNKVNANRFTDNNIPFLSDKSNFSLTNLNPKSPMRFLYIFLFVALANLNSPQTFGYQSNGSGGGNWKHGSSWQSNESPPQMIGNSAQFSSSLTVYENDSVFLGSQAEIEKLTVDNNGFTFHVYGKLTIGDLLSKNRLNINVYSGGKFTIFEDIETENTLNINVEEGGFLDVRGSLILKNNAGLVIDGEFAADIITGNNNNQLSGTGALYISDPENVTGLDLSNFNGVIVYGNTDLSLPSPYDFEGYATYPQSNSPQFVMEWMYDSDTDMENTDHIGFQLLRNNGEANSYDAVVITDPENPIVYEDYDVAISASHAIFNFTDKALNLEDFPRYWIRAVYIRNGVIVFSGIDGPIAPPSPLPVNLVAFDATTVDGGITITWTTATEINNMGFEIHRYDPQSQHWQMIGWIDGNYYQNDIIHYSFVDGAPLSGNNYYRLRQVDYDGRHEFFGPVAAFHGDDLLSNALILDKRGTVPFIIIPGEKGGVLQVFDMQGRMIVHEFAIGQTILNLKGGSYIARFSDGMDISTLKFTLTQ